MELHRKPIAGNGSGQAIMKLGTKVKSSPIPPHADHINQKVRILFEADHINQKVRILFCIHLLSKLAEI